MGRFEIKLRIRSEDELYNRFDEDRLVLSDDVISYITDRFEEKHFGDGLALRIISDTPVNKDAVTAAFARNIQIMQQKKKKEYKRNIAKQLKFLVVGVIFLAAGILLAISLNKILLAVISTIGSFAIWEAASIWIVKNPQKRLESMLLSRLSETELIIEVRDGEARP
ncbi:MAG: hypothetical protein IJG50_09460 [Clostridia bacterium]|nr:hypothetical protein [Clostridia bacterium]